MLDGIDVVWHLSANPEVRIGITEPEKMFRQNVDATRRVIEAMARAMDHEIAGENFRDIPTRAMARAAYDILNEWSTAKRV